MKTIKLSVLIILFIGYSGYGCSQENENTHHHQQERLKKENAKAEQLNSELLQSDPNSTNSRADENKLVSKPYFSYRNQVLDGMNVVGKGIIRKFDREMTNAENIRALNEWVKENIELFKPEFLEKSNEYFSEALKK